VAPDGPSSEVIFFDEKLRPHVFQPPGLLEEGDCYHVIGSTAFVTVKKAELPTTVDLDGSMFFVDPPKLQVIGSTKTVLTLPPDDLEKADVSVHNSLSKCVIIETVATKFYILIELKCKSSPCL
jgi:hypothetical protein